MLLTLTKAEMTIHLGTCHCGALVFEPSSVYDGNVAGPMRGARVKLHAVRANGITFTCYVHGDGEELMLLLHGFPDDAATMLRMMEALPTKRFTLVAPHMRGFGPTSRAPDRRYQYADLGRDVLGLIEAFGFEAAHIYGHDFGALAGYAAAQLAPECVARLVAASVPPPATFLANLPRHPGQLARSWYVGLMQVPWLAKRLLESQDDAMIALLWRLWSPGWRWQPDRLAKVRNSLGRRGVSSTVVRYYRGLLLDALLDHNAWRASFELAMRPISVPTTVLFGERDGCIGPEMYERVERSFDTPQLTVKCLEECGHFPHHERMDAVLDAMLST